MSRLLARVGVLLVVLALLLIVVRTVGGQAKNPLSAMFTEITLANGQTQTCWHEICPGQTNYDQAQKLLESDVLLTRADWAPYCWESHAPYYLVCLQSTDGNLVSIYLDFDNVRYSPDATVHPQLPQFWLGDAIALWGYPVAASSNFCSISSLVFKGNSIVRVYWVKDRTDFATIRLDPNASRVYVVTLAAPSFTPDGSSPTGRWKGFDTEISNGCMGD